MTEHTHYVFSLRLAAWWGNNSIYCSNVSDARRFTRDEAVSFCRKRFNPGEGLNCVPVAIEDVSAVTLR